MINSFLHQQLGATLSLKFSSILIACFALCLSAHVEARADSKPDLLICSKEAFGAVLNPVRWANGELIVLSMGLKGDDDKIGYGRIVEYEPNGGFVADFFLDGQFKFPSSGPSTTVRFSAKNLVAIILVTPRGQIAGYQVSTSCKYKKAAPN